LRASNCPGYAKEAVLKRVIALALVLFALLVAGCQKKKPVAVVEGEEISQKMFNLYLDERSKMLASRGTEVDKDSLRQAVLEQLIAERLLVQGAKEKGIKVSDAEVDSGMDLIKKRVGAEQFEKGLKEGGLTEREYKAIIRDRMMIDAFVETFAPKEKIEEKEVKDFYDSNPDFFKRPETVQLRLIQVKDEEEANRIAKEMKEGNLDFDETAEKLKAENRASVGNYGWADLGMLPPEMASALKEMKAGEYGGPFKGKGVYYLARIKDRKGARVVGLDEARDTIKQLLVAREQQQAVVDWLDQRKKNAKIKVNLETGG
jgi:parvulin-like peptidyl-prolyl isomerase